MFRRFTPYLLTLHALLCMGLCSPAETFHHPRQLLTPGDRRPVSDVGANSLRSVALTDVGHEGHPDFVSVGNSNASTVLISQNSSPAPTGTLSASPEPSALGQTFSLNVKLVPPSGSTATLTGTAAFFIDGNPVGAAPVSGNVASLNGPANLTPGTHTLSAMVTQLSDGVTSYPALTLAGSHTVVGTPVQILLAAAPNPATVGQQVQFVVAIANAPGTPISAPQPVGTLSLAEGNTVIASANLTSPTSVGSFLANDTFSTAGAHTVQLTYSGDSTHAPASSTVVINVIAATPPPPPPPPPPPAGSYTLSVAPSTLTVRGGTTANFNVAATSVENYSGSLALTVGTLPPGATATFAPASLTVGQNGTSYATLSIATKAIPPYALARSQESRRDPALPLVLAASSLPLLLKLRRRGLRSPSLLLFVLTIGAVLAITGCGPDVVREINPTPATTYTIPVTATDPATGIAHTANVTLTITP